MKLAIISPINYPEFVLQGDIAFTLTDWILKFPEYQKYYQQCKLYKITDNNAAENGISSPIINVLSATRAVGSNECWASDKLYDRKETLKLTKEFIKALKPYDTFKVVGIPQGATLKEWLNCYKKLVAMPRIDVIALSKYSVPKCFAKIAKSDELSKCRIFAVKYLHKKNLVTKELHCAGADHKIIDEIKAYKKYPMVRSIDSNIMVKLGIHRIKIDRCQVEPIERLDHNIKNLDKEQLNIISYNIQKVKEALQD